MSTKGKIIAHNVLALQRTSTRHLLAQIILCSTVASPTPSLPDETSNLTPDPLHNVCIVPYPAHPSSYKVSCNIRTSAQYCGHHSRGTTLGTCHYSGGAGRVGRGWGAGGGGIRITFHVLQSVYVYEKVMFRRFQ